jgi:hypothetical protein
MSKERKSGFSRDIAGKKPVAGAAGNWFSLR